MKQEMKQLIERGKEKRYFDTIVQRYILLGGRFMFTLEGSDIGTSDLPASSIPANSVILEPNFKY